MTEVERRARDLVLALLAELDNRSMLHQVGRELYMEAREELEAIARSHLSEVL